MKKTFSIFAIIVILSMTIFMPNSYAAALDTIDIDTDKTTVRPGEEVLLNINFGQNLGAYTFNIDYDNSIFEYVSVDGGNANAVNDKVKVTFHDPTGGTSPRNYMAATFRAKADITTSNPTEFTVTAEGLANPDASVQFDDITTPIIKNITVEPEYVDYTIKLDHSGEIVKGQEKAMSLSYSSPMGRYYEHARLIAEANTPVGATVQLLATDSSNLEHDIIQSGWGDAQGSKIGGKDVSQVLQTKAIFSDEGNYTITLKLIDRDNSDSVIAEKAFNLSVVETSTPTPTPTIEATPTPSEATPDNKQDEISKTEETPNKLPKTGSNLYIPIAVILITLVSAYIYFNKKK